ncbi:MULTISPECIES: hypothetical protein [unclassified Brevundimonas]|uniref:hypothetical protein n=1 Tax=unclassified Brevundimonas TaxID=2622653 RepID=UPI003F91F966
MKTKALIARAFGAAMAGAACVSSGTNFSFAAVDALQPGVSTRADAERTLGRPNSISNMPDGTVLLQWIHTQAVLVSAESKHVALLFDANGKFIRVQHQTQTSM